MIYNLTKAVTFYYTTSVEADSEEDAVEFGYNLTDDEWNVEPGDYDEVVTAEADPIFV